MWAVKTQEILWGVEEYLEEASAIHLDAIVAIITLMPRKRSARHSGRSIALCCLLYPFTR